MSFLMKLGAFIPVGLIVISVIMLIVFLINRKTLGLFWKIILPLGACLIILGVIISWIITVIVAKSVTM